MLGKSDKHILDQVVHNLNFRRNKQTVVSMLSLYRLQSEILTVILRQITLKIPKDIHFNDIFFTIKGIVCYF